MGDVLMMGPGVTTSADHTAGARLLASLISHLGSAYAISVGAAREQSVCALLDAGATAVDVFEPFPASVAALRRAFGDTPAVRIFEVALGERDAPATLHVVEDEANGRGVFQSLVRRGERPTRQITQEIPVHCRTLDALVAEGTVPAEIGILRLDATWSDQAVLKGMGRLTSAVVTMQFWSDPDKSRGPAANQVADVRRFMAERGYSNIVVVKQHGQFETLHVNDDPTRAGERGSVIFIHDTMFPRLAAPIFEAASAAQHQLIDRVRLLADESQEQVRRVEDLARSLEGCAATTRLALLDEQELALEAYLRLSRTDGPWQWVTQQLGVLYQHAPVPLYVPQHYLHEVPLPSPPTISIVTPMLNGARFVRFTLDSVVDQTYPALEYIVQDGGSTDGSFAIVEQYQPRLAQVNSERDTGMAQAINRGFRHATGEIMAYLNADDVLLPGTLHFVAAYFAAHPDVDVVYGHRVLIDTDHAEVGRWVLPRHDDDVLSWTDYVPQETLFWRRSIWERAGGAMDESFRFALDWDLLLRFRQAGATFVRLPRFLAAFRVHDNQKTATELSGVGAEEITRIRVREAGRPISNTEIRQRIEPYIRRHKIYHKLYLLGVLAY